jgi:hypothetical protein
MRRLISVIFFLCSFLLAEAQSPSVPKYEKELLQEDLKELKKTILESHPDPFVFCTEKEFEDMFLACNLALEDEMNFRDFSLIVASFIGVLKDSHTAMDYNQLLQLQLDYEGYMLPLGLERVESDKDEKQFKIIVRSDWENEIAKGSELVSINGLSIEKIYQRALEYACIEGQATRARDAVATAILPMVAGLMHPYGARNSIDVIPLNSVKPVSLSLKGYRSKEYHKKLYQRHLEGKDAEVKFELDEQTNLAILKIGTFAPSSGRKFRKQITEAMKRVGESNAEDLVLDIRGNGGGSSAWVEYVYSFIDPAGYNTPSNVIGRNSEIAMDRSRFFHTALGKIFTFLFFRKNEDVQSFRKIASLQYGEMDTLYFHVPSKQEQSQVFSGNCYLLINGLTASAGVDFTNAFKSRKRGPVIGEQCLGPQSGTWGNPASFTLPNSGLRVSISTIRYNYDNTFEYQMSAIEPDYFVDCIPEDIRQEVDTQIEFVKKLIADKK